MEQPWTTADYAFVISIFSACLALASFIWNIWSKFIYPKPKVRVSVARCHTDLANGLVVLEDRAGKLPGDWNHEMLENSAVQLSVVNYGPGSVIITNIIARKARWFNKWNRSAGILTPYRSYPHDLETSGPVGEPQKLEVGVEALFYFPAIPDWFEKEKLKRFGVLDSFGRQIYAGFRETRALKNSIKAR